MTGNTLEQQRARELLAAEMQKPASNINGLGTVSETAALRAIEAAMRLSAPPDRIVLWSRNVSPHWFFMAQLSQRPPMEGSPVYETMDPIVLQGSPEALRLSAGADWVLVPRPMAEVLASAADEWMVMFGEVPGLEKYDRFNYLPAVELARDELRQLLAAAPRHEPGEG